MRRNIRLLFLAIPVILLVTALGVVVWSAQRALNRSAAIAGTQHQIPFTLRPLDLAAAPAQNPGFEPVTAQDAYISGTELSGTLYLAGPNGLTILAADGTPRQTLRTGFELPVAPIVAVATGQIRSASSLQVLLATSGAGLLLLDPNPKTAPTLYQLLPNNESARDLTAILPLSSGDLLIGTRHSGVLLYNGTTLVPLPNLPATDITALAAADSTSILIGTRTAGLFYLHAGTIQHADASSGMPDNQVESILVADGQAFAGTPLGIAQFTLNQPETAAFKPTRILAPGLFAHTLAIAGGDLQVGTLDQGIQPVPLSANPRLRHATLDVAYGYARRIDNFIFSNGRTGPLYALGDGEVLEHWQHGWHPPVLASTETLTDRNISALAFAPDGSLYVGFFDRGLNVISANTSAPIRHFEDDHLFCINRLVLDPARQTIAAATANGLVLFDRQGIPRQTLTRRDGLISDHVTNVAFTRSGTTLATPAGLTFITPSGTESLYAFEGLVNNHVYTLASANDRLLAGTLGGISLLEANAVKRNYTATNSGLKHNWITALAPASQGGWLVGTYGAGIQTLSPDTNTFSAIDLPAGVPHDLVINPNALLVTRSHVYAGTLGHGMLVFDIATNRWAIVDKGLPSLNVTAFAERDGTLYIGTENGLVRIAEAKLP